MLGTEELQRYLDKYELELDHHYDGIMSRFARKPWNKFITPENQKFASNDAIDFLDKLLRYDHMERLTAKEAMAHPYFGKFFKWIKVLTIILEAVAKEGEAGAAEAGEKNMENSTS